MPPKKDSTGGGDVDYDNDTPERLNINSTLVEIADAMKTTGLNFVNKAVQGMPPSTFLAFEAVNWIMENIKGKDVYFMNRYTRYTLFLLMILSKHISLYANGQKLISRPRLYGIFTLQKRDGSM